MSPLPRHLLPSIAAALVATTAAAPAAPVAAAQFRIADAATVSYRGYTFQVPRAWPVVNLAEAPTTCVRFDQHAVYLGAPGSTQHCPAKVIGRTEALLIGPATLAAATQITDVQISHEFDATAPGITVTATYGSDRTLMQTILATALPAATSA